MENRPRLFFGVAASLLIILASCQTTKQVKALVPAAPSTIGTEALGFSPRAEAGHNTIDFALTLGNPEAVKGWKVEIKSDKGVQKTFSGSGLEGAGQPELGRQERAGIPGAGRSLYRIPERGLRKHVRELLGDELELRPRHHPALGEDRRDHGRPRPRGTRLRLAGLDRHRRFLRRRQDRQLVPRPPRSQRQGIPQLLRQVAAERGELGRTFLRRRPGGARDDLQGDG